jgi:nicotinate-nucleotide adenylyltransferase
MRLGIFGGTFDPVHYGHLLLAECCREQCELDAVWFLPAAVPPHKKDWKLSPAEDRAAMLELAVAGHDAFDVCKYEIERGGVNYTFETLEHFAKEDAGRELFFLLGADMLRDLPRWREPARIIELALPVAVRRPGAGELDFAALSACASPERIERIRAHQVEMPEIGISGSEIRRRTAEGLSIRYRTPRAVEKYIEAKGLFKK